MHTYNPAEQAFMNPAGGYRGIIETTQTIAVATLADVNNVSFPVKKGEVWIFEMDLQAVGNTNGLAFAVTGPAASLVKLTVFGNTTGITAVSTETEVAIDTATSVAFAAAAVDNYLRITCSYIPSADGTFKLQCSTVSGTNSSTLLKGSAWSAVRAK